ncbi:ABC transporter ATP-binding protein, partial [Streptomyces fradiae]
MSLDLTDITLIYPDGENRLTALDRVTLEVPKGTLTAVVGPSGSGKSSLLAVAATLITPDTGTVTIDGQATTGMTRAELTDLRRHKIGIVFQQPNLLPSLTAAEQLQVMAQIDGRKPRTARDRAMELLDGVGLADQAHRRPHQLSGGQR